MLCRSGSMAGRLGGGGGAIAFDVEGASSSDSADVPMR